MAKDVTYIGRAFERCVDFIGNDINPSNPYPAKITNDEFKEIFENAKILYPQLEDYFNGIDNIRWTGSHTISTSADLLINNKITEVKYLSGSNGSTWVNTTINCINDGYGFPKKYNYYLKEYDVYSFLEDELGRHAISRTNSSPMGQKEASKVMKERPDFCDELKEVEIEARQAFVYDIVEYFESHPKQYEQFCIDVVTKSICGNKKMPEILVEFNTSTKKANIKTKEELLGMLGDGKINYTQGQCQFFVGKFRFGFTWKNGVGLFNPVLKVYI